MVELTAQRLYRNVCFVIFRQFYSTRWVLRHRRCCGPAIANNYLLTWAIFVRIKTINNLLMHITGALFISKSAKPLKALLVDLTNNISVVQR